MKIVNSDTFHEAMRGNFFAAAVGLLTLAQTLSATRGSTAADSSVIDQDRRFLEELEQKANPPEPVAQKQELPIDQETVGHFLQAYVRAAAQKNPQTERSYFGDSVIYFNRGPLSPKALEKELANDHQRNEPVTWMGLQGVSASGPDGVTARFSVRKGAKYKRGEMEVREATIVRTPKGGLRMTQLQKASANHRENPWNLP